MNNIEGRFTRVSKTTWSDNHVLIGFVGSVYPHDLKPDQISFIKIFYMMPNSTHEIYNEWPSEIEPAYPAVKSNFKNGFLLLRR